MKQYKVMPQGGRWFEVEARTPETAYRGVCCWFSPSTPVAILDPQTGHTVIYTRTLDGAGNLVQVNP